MSIIEIIKALSEYGITLVLSAIVIYVVIKCIKLRFSKAELDAQRKAHDHALSVRDSIGDEIYQYLNQFIQAHEGLRLQVIEFTNTVTSVAYLPFKYMSCTYEVVSYGTRPEARCIDKLSTSLFGPFLSQLGRKGYLSLTPQSAQDMSGVLHDLYEQIGGEHMLAVMLKSEKSKCIGYVAFYTNKEITNYDINDLLDMGEKLSTLLGVFDN